MRLTLGLTYTILKADQTTITFKFIGDEPPLGIVNGEKIPLYQILSGGFISYWEVQ